MNKTIYKTNATRLASNIMKATFMALLTLILFYSAFLFLNDKDSLGFLAFVVVFAIATISLRMLALSIRDLLNNTVYYSMDDEIIARHFLFRRKVEYVNLNDVTGYSGGKNRTRGGRQKLSFYLKDGNVLEIQDDAIESFDNLRKRISGFGLTYLGWN